MLIAGIVSGLAHALASDAVKALAKAVATFARELLSAVYGAVSGATAIHPGASWFSGGPSSPVGITSAIAGSVLGGLFLLQVIRALLRREGAGLARALSGTLRAAFGTATFLAILTTALGVTDTLAGFAIHRAGGSIGAVAGKLMGYTALGSLLAGDPAAVIILGLVIIAAALVLYATLLVRSIGVYAVAMAGPVVMAGQVYDTSRGWLRRWVEVLAALVVSKLAIVLLFVLGMAMAHGAHGLTGLIAGTVVVLMASFSPLLVYKLFHFVGLEAGHLVAGSLHRPGSSAPVSAFSAMRNADKVRSLMAPVMGAAAGGGAGAAAGAAASSTIGETRRKTTAGGSGGPSSRPGGPSGDQPGSRGPKGPGDGPVPGERGEGRPGPGGGQPGAAGRSGSGSDRQGTPPAVPRPGPAPLELHPPTRARAAPRPPTDHANPPPPPP